MKTQFSAILSAVLLANFSVQGESLIYEPFDQDFSSDANLNGKSGGIGLNTWSDNGTVVGIPQTLNYGDLANEGSQIRLNNGGGTDAWVTTTSVLADNDLLDDGAELWFSYMYLKPNGGGSNEKGGFAFGTDRLDGAFNGQNMIDGGNGLGLAYNNFSLSAASWSGGGDANFGQSFNIGSYGNSILVVGKIEWGATNTDDETITVYFPSTTDLGTLGPSFVQTLTAVDQSLFDTISMTLRNAPFGGDVVVNGQFYDEIRFGATLEDVTPVPEPGALALLALGGMLVVRRRHT
ncbi:MAG: PEP-CTERM sorting domain-containing protein [Planctomycetota bacterium]